MRTIEKTAVHWIRGNRYGVILIVGCALYFIFLLIFACAG
jgi:hypothetical protein